MASTVSKKAKSFFVVMKCDMKSETIYHLTHILLYCHCRVYERESERRIKSYRPAGKLGFTDGDHYHSQALGYNNDTLKSNKPPGRSDDENRTIVGNETVREHSRSDVQSPEKVRDDTDKNDKGAFSSRNQFDRASQLRRSRKKRCHHRHPVIPSQRNNPQLLVQ